jgi:competence/damage-inducible protein CinA-like protein
VRAAILVTGDEILRGRIQERNAGLIARSLEPLGVEVDRVAIVGDDLDGLVRALEGLLAGPADLICTTGGLGPTHDDLTMEAVARATGRRLAIDAGALAMVEARHAGIAVDAATRAAVQEKQASLPAGAVVLPPVGTAPGCLLEHEGRLVAVLPGPPWELAAMWEAALAEPMLAALMARADPPRERVLRLFAVPESRVVEIVAGLDADTWDRLRVGVCARHAELEVTIRSAPGDEWAADALEERLGAVLGDALYSRDGGSVDEVVARALVAAGQTVAVAESCTGGGLGARLTDRPGSSAYALGGVISYDDEVKRSVLGVDPEVIRRHGAVSRECAREMAEGVRRLVGSDWALSVTGIAGPGGGTPDKPVGLVYVGRAGPDGVVVEELRLRGDRGRIRDRSVAMALHLLRRGLVPSGV